MSKRISRWKRRQISEFIEINPEMTYNEIGKLFDVSGRLVGYIAEEFGIMRRGKRGPIKNKPKHYKKRKPKNIISNILKSINKDDDYLKIITQVEIAQNALNEITELLKSKYLEEMKKDKSNNIELF